MIETRDEHWGRVALLLALAALVWWFNARQLMDDSDETASAGAEVAAQSDIDIHERTQILRPRLPAEVVPLVWDPFARQPLGNDPEPEPAPTPVAQAPVPRPPPPLGLEYIGLVEGEARQVFILRSRAGLEFLALNDQIGPWRLTEHREEALVFEDEQGRVQELATKMP
ncbi:hypothetical protein [Acanthopleuribacter pedis]|uniref:Type II secretion system protein GspC N-terminal domain-containing protein n=1 Tax=Acanthopleuribacter pedis TaxID=442870 RepID=A0A8J7QBE5_9BACT|nr:hypothetical protein [Acanthopleuribacter pedis]MBO1323032.1 hypothetical protein [Acanthopleuribacter pedis]